MVTLDHVGVPARDAKASAQFLVDILGLAPAEPVGPDGDIYCVSMAYVSLLYCPSSAPASQHVAFRVDQPTFAGVLDRLRKRGIAFGNDPEDATNGQTSDPHGGLGRVYFVDPEGHFLEVTV